MTGSTLKILQHYMNGQLIVAEQLLDYITLNKVDIILAQDPPHSGTNTKQSYYHERPGHDGVIMVNGL